MAEEEASTEGEQEAKPKSKKGMIIAVVAVLLIGGVGGALALMGGGDAAKEGEEVVHYETVELETFIVNLSENSSFLKFRIMLEYNPKLVFGGGQGEGGGHGGGVAIGGGAAGGGEENHGPPGVLGSRLPMIQDSIIRVVSSKRAEDVLTPEGKEELKEELIEAINEATGLDEGPVVNIYFLEFIVQ